jgi:hypothetical protein
MMHEWQPGVPSKPRPANKGEWLALMQHMLIRGMGAAPDQTCLAMARNLWNQIVVFSDDFDDYDIDGRGR